jgi:transposase-like protein
MAGNVRGKQASAIIELLNPANRNYADVAAKCGIAERQLYRWMDDADFQGELAAARKALLERTLDRLAGANVHAVDALLSVLSTQNPAGLRRLAANDILNHHSRLVDLVDLQQRITDMEAVLYEKQSTS